MHSVIIEYSMKATDFRNMPVQWEGIYRKHNSLEDAGAARDERTGELAASRALRLRWLRRVNERDDAFVGLLMSGEYFFI